MQKRAYFLLFFITLCVKTTFAATNFFELRIDFKTAEERTITVTLVMPEELHAQRDIVLGKTERALRLCEQKMGLSLIDDLSFFFDVEPDSHNGLTTVIPTNRIDIMTEAPDLEGSIGLNSDYLTETLVHELSHMTVMQRYGGIFSLFDPLVGNAARPLGLWPRWMHEGLAVWTEGIVGGRPHSGYLDFDRRRYADYYERKQKHPFDNEQIDGSRELDYPSGHERVERGALPYHFGYYLISSLFEGSPALGETKAQTPISLPDFIRTSAKSLGMSFRVILREKFSVDLDSRFEDLRTRWSDSSALPKLKTPMVSTGVVSPVATAATMEGPFFARLDAKDSSLHRSVTWIERNGKHSTDIKLKARADGEADIATFKWHRAFSSPLQAVYVGKKKWLVLTREHPDRGHFFYDDGKSVEHKIYLFNDSKLMCAFPVADRIREFHYSQGWLSWVRSSADGYEVAEKQRTAVNCTFNGKVETIVKGTAPFQRITSLYVDANNSIYSITIPPDNTRASAVIAEHLVWNGAVVDSEIPLSFAVPYGDGLIATAMTPKHWGPVRISKNKSGPHIDGWIPMRTGAYRSVPSIDGTGLWTKESLWEEDRLTAYQKSDLLPLKAAAIKSELPIASTDLSNQNLPAREDSYGAWPSIWPHFWVPTVMAVTGGYAITGQTFYEDLSKRWAGATFLGYDSFVARPLFFTDLTRNRLGLGPFNSITAAGFYTPVSTLFAGQNFIQERYGASLNLNAGGTLGSFRLLEVPNLTFQKAQPTIAFDGYSRVIPGLGLTLASSKSLDPESSSFQLFSVEPAFSIYTNFRFIKRPDSYSRFRLQFPILGAGVLFTSEYGYTNAKNFPISYFEAGGLPQVAVGNSIFLTRGFSYRLISAREALRIGTELGISLGKLGAGMGWNRLSLSSSEIRLIGETVSFSSFSGLRYRVGRQYFSTLGSELDVIGSTLFYVNYRISFGAYRGFGPFGETRYALILRSGLDI